MHVRSLLLVAALAPLSSSALAQQKRVYIANDDHTDYFWTADDVAYRAAFLNMLDFYVAQADTSIANGAPSDHQGRFAADGSYWLWEYERNRTPAQFQHLMDRIASGHLSAPMTALVSCYGGCPAEAVLRGMYYAGDLERRFDMRFKLAVAMEDQTLPWGLASLWAGSGARWSWKGICGCVSQTPNAATREHEAYWYTGPDGQRVLMKWNSMLSPNNNQGIGGYAECRDVTATVNYVTSEAGFLARWPYLAIGAFGKGWDDLQTLTNEFMTLAPTLTNANRRVIVSNEEDFFADFEASYGASLPSVAYTYGNEWELYCASMAEVSARVKRDVERLRSAEALAAVERWYDPGFALSLDAQRDQAHMNLGLYWEHDWTADGPVPRTVRAQFQRNLGNQIHAYVDALETAGRVALGARIRGGGVGTRFYAFNPLSWTRSDAADFIWPSGGPVHVVDVTTGLETPSQLVVVDGRTYVRVWAENVPSLGYKVFEVLTGAGQTFTDAATVTSNVLENARYRVTLDARGAISSLIDKAQGNREFAATASATRLNDLGGTGGTISVENSGPVSVTLKTVTTAGLAHTTRVTLLRGGERIDVRNDITQNFSAVTHWDWRWNLTSPVVDHEEVGALARAKLRTQGGSYATTSARYDYITLNHFADVSGTDGAGATLSNADCYYAKLGTSTPGFLDTTTPLIRVLAGGQVDGTNLGIQNQNGDSLFLQRFAVRTFTARNPTAAMRFALEHQNPLFTGAVSGSAPRLPADRLSFVRVSNPDVLVWSLKPHEDGARAGTVVRLWNLSSAPQTARVRFQPAEVTAARRTTHLETDLGPALVDDHRLEVTLPQQGLGTWAVDFVRAAHGLQ